MGVPSLYKWITRRFPEIKHKPEVLRESFEDKSITDNLYLDFNAVIHPCCNKSLGCMDDTDTELYKNLEGFLDEVIERIKPRKLVYIAVDGVAPRAKMNQQRARRFVHAKEVMDQGGFYFKDDCGNGKYGEHKNCDDSNKRGDDSINRCDDATNNQCDPVEESMDSSDTINTGVFDTNAISPGTEFMYRLDIFLQELISYKMSCDPNWESLNVIYSSCKIPGEGEQKILEYIRKHQSKKNSVVIFSPDADLIFLGLTLFDYTVMILREEHKNTHISNENITVSASKRDLSLVDIQKLKSLLIRDFKQAIKIPFNTKRFLEDWVLLCFTVGNDFLPCTPCFEIRTDALDKLSKILQSVYLKTKSYITDNGKINFDILREFFIEAARWENDFIIEKRNNLISTRRRMNLPYSESEEYFLETERGKIQYYIEKMGINSEADLFKACEEYIKGLVWVYNYYFYDIPSWEWFYPYHFAPFMADLALIKNISVKFNPGRPLKPFEQLLCVLPPISKDLLPATLHGIFEEHKDFYPVSFKLDMFQKCMDWQAVPILPFIPVREISKAFERKQKDLSYSECERNTMGYPIVFSRQPRIVAKVYPMYTEMKTCDLVGIEEFTGKVFALNKFKKIEEEVDFNGRKYVNRVVKFSFDQRRNLNK